MDSAMSKGSMRITGNQNIDSVESLRAGASKLPTMPEFREILKFNELDLAAYMAKEIKAPKILIGNLVMNTNQKPNEFKFLPIDL